MVAESQPEPRTRSKNSRRAQHMVKKYGTVGYGVLAASCVLSALGVAACSRHEASTPGASAAPEKLPAGFQTPSVARLQLLRGADQQAIRAYLESVKEIKPQKFDVQWSADTVAVSREQAMRSLHAVNDDGTEYTFASSEPVVSKLKKGAILWIYDITIGRIVDVGIIGNETIIYTTPVALTEAMTKADIEFAAQPDFTQAYGSYQTFGTAAPPQSSTLSPRPSPFRRVALQETREPGAKPPESRKSSEDLVVATPGGFIGTVNGFEYTLNYASTPDKLNLDFEASKAEGGAPGEIHREQQDEFFEALKEELAARQEALEYKAQLAKYGEELAQAGGQQVGPNELANFTATFGSKGGQATSQAPGEAYNLLTKEQAEVTEKYHKAVEEQEQAKQKEESLQKAGTLAAHAFFIVSDNLDVRFIAKMELDRMSLANSIQIDGGQVQSAKINFSNLSGRIDLEFIGRLGEGDAGTVSVPVADIPVLFDIPMPIEGIPFVAQLGADFLLKIFLSGNHATHHWVSHYTFSGSSGLSATPAQTDSTGTQNTSEPVLEQKTAVSPGTSGLVLAIQLPKVGFGLGAFGGAALAFFDIVNVITITNAASVAVLNPPCKRFTQQMVCHMGVEVSVLPTVPFVGAVVSHLLSYTHSLHIPYQNNGTKKDLCKPPLREWVEPDIPMCHI